MGNTYILRSLALKYIRTCLIYYFHITYQQKERNKDIKQQKRTIRHLFFSQPSGAGAGVRPGGGRQPRDGQQASPRGRDGRGRPRHLHGAPQHRQGQRVSEVGAQIPDNSSNRGHVIQSMLNQSLLSYSKTILSLSRRMEDSATLVHLMCLGVVPTK